MKGKSGRLTILALAGLWAVVLGRRADEGHELAPTPESEALWQGYPATVPLRSFAKHQIARDVIAGERSLGEAAALFRELNRLAPALPDSSRIEASFFGPQSIGSHSEEELLCWQVITWVRSPWLDGTPGREAAAIRLEAEVRTMLQDGAGIRLPGAGSLVSAQELLARARNALTPSQWQAYLGRGEGAGRGAERHR